MNNALDIKVTAGEWIVNPTYNNPGYLTIRRADTNEPLAIVVPTITHEFNWADAALMTASKHMLEALISLSELINGSKEVFSIDDVNAIISKAIEKIHAESDV